MRTGISAGGEEGDSLAKTIFALMEIIKKYFTDLTDIQVSQFGALEGLYREWNAKINVVSRKDIDSLYERHVLHSLAIAKVVFFSRGQQILDLGTGGGFPGIPLAILYPEIQFTLVDSIAKKINVTEAVAQEIGLTNLHSLHSRVEDIHHQKFDYVVSRAVAPLKELMKWSKPLIRVEKPKIHVGKDSVTPGQHFPPGLICLKGGNLDQEILESNTRPFIVPLSTIYDEPFFNEKYLLYVQRR